MRDRTSGSGRSEAAASPLGVGQSGCLDDLQRKPRLHDKLRNLHAVMDLKGRSAVVDENHAQFTSVAFVDCARTVEYRHSMLQRQAAPGSYLSFSARWKLDGEACPDQSAFAWGNGDVNSRVQIQTGVAGMRPVRQDG